MKWLGPTLRVLSWTGLIALGATNVAQLGVAGVAAHLGGLPLDVLTDFICGSMHKLLKKHPEGVASLEFKAFHECVFESIHRGVERGTISKTLDLGDQVKGQAREAQKLWDETLIELQAFERFDTVLSGRTDPHQSDIEELIQRLYPMLKGAALSTVAADVFLNFERKFIELLSKDDAQQLYRQRLLSAVLEMHRDMMAKLEAIHTDVKEGRGELGEIRQMLVGKLAIDTNAPESKQEALRLHNEAIDVIQGRAEGDAVDLLSQALKLDPTFFNGFLSRGIAYGAREDYLNALSDFDRALSIRPGDTKALELRSVVREQRMDFAGAVEDARQALSREPANIDLHLRLASALLAANRNAEARDVYLKALELTPRSVEAYLGLALVTESPEDRLVMLERAVALDPNSGKAHLDLGLTFQKLQRMDEALKEFHLAVDLDPKLGQAWTQIAARAAETEGREMAEKLYLRAIEADPKFGPTYGSFGLMRFEQGDTEGAIAVLSQGLEIQPIPEAFALRGLCYANLNENTKAFEDYSYAIEMRPNYATAYNNRGELYRNVNMLAEAINDYSMAIESDPNNFESYTERARCRILTGDVKGAISDCGRAIEIDPDHYEGYFRRARAFESVEDFASAEADYRKIISMHDDENVFNNLGCVCTAQGKYADAIDALTKSIELGIGARGYVNRAVALLKLGRVSESASDLRQAIDEVPDWRNEIQRNTEYASLMQDPVTRAAIG